MNKKNISVFLGITLLLSAYGIFSSLRKADDKSMRIEEISVEQSIIPILKGKEVNKLIRLDITTKGKDSPLRLERLNCALQGDMDELLEISLLNIEDKKSSVVGKTNSVGKKVQLNSQLVLREGKNTVWLSAKLKETADIDGKLSIECSTVCISGKKHSLKQDKLSKDFLFGMALRKHKEDDVDTYRIPGLTTTNNGTLIAVYDVRYNNKKDLQEDIDVGLSRSTDGGQTWEPMRIIMDMGNWGGNPPKLNGIGDPCVLYDNHTGTLWVSGLWMSGGSEKEALWNSSNPGMTPEETGQFMLVKSTDDGLTWSKPINITKQIKLPEWQLLFQGPGRGICMKNGTLVFPAQFKTKLKEKSLDGGEFTCFSTIVYSENQGKTWHIGTGAKSNTTEAQVVELKDGSLMLNMRDNRNKKDKSETNGRAVATTTDFGKTWQVHPSSNSALPDANCMASIVSAENQEYNQVLFFSNPNNKRSRRNLTIKASLDDGLTWDVGNQLEIYEPNGFGYSCMTMIDKQTIGILYEGSRELYFQRIAVADILN